MAGRRTRKSNAASKAVVDNYIPPSNDSEDEVLDDKSTTAVRRTRKASVTSKAAMDDHAPSGKENEGKVFGDGDDSGLKRKARVVYNESAAKKKKAIRRPASSVVIEDAERATSNDYSSEPILRMSLSNDTRILNSWLKARDGLSVKREPRVIKLEDTESTYLGDLPNQPNRKYEYELELVDIEVTLDPPSLGDTNYIRMGKDDVIKHMDQFRKIIKTWRLRVHNAALPKDKQVRLRFFPEIENYKSKIYHMAQGYQPKTASKTPRDPKYFWWVQGGPLDTNVCDAQEANMMAKEICRLMNKLPCKIKEEDFPEFVRHGSPLGRERILIEWLSLRALGRPSLTSNIRPVFLRNRFEAGYYNFTWPLLTSDKGDSHRHILRLPVFCTDYELAQKIKVYGFLPLTITDSDFAEDGLEAVPEAPTWFPFKMSFPATMKNTFEQARRERLWRFIAWKLFGHVGTRHDINEKPAQLVKMAKDRKWRTGPCEGRPLFRFSPANIKIVPAALPRNLIEGPFFAISTGNLPQADVAVACQSAYEVFQEGKGLLATFDELAVSVQELILKKTLKSNPLTRTNHCKCGTDEELRKTTGHFCMIDMKLQICSKMARTNDGRLVCLKHFRDGPPSAEERMRYIIRYKAMHLENTMMDLEDREAIARRMNDEFCGSDGFFDYLDGKIHDDQHAVLALHAEIDAINPLFEADGEYVVHHALNCGLVTALKNRFKGTDIPLAMASAGDAVRRKGTEEFLPDIENAFDHYTKIRTVLPYSKKARKNLAQKVSSTWFTAYEALMRTGEYDGTKPTWNYKPRTLTSWFTDRYSVHWNAADILRIDAICREIEQDPDINPTGLKLPRGPAGPNGEPGAPWLFNPKHMFNNHSWEYNDRLFHERFKRMDETCDLANDHEDENGTTLFLTCVFLWFKLGGGKDKLLGLRMTVFHHHALRFSIGRDTHVLPGSIMRTGWKCKHPTSLKDYDDSQRTIIMEAWMSNRGKSYFTTSPEMLAKYVEDLAGITTTSEYWTSYPPTQTEDISWPKDWTETTHRQKPAKTGVTRRTSSSSDLVGDEEWSADEETSMDDATTELDDEEDMFSVSLVDEMPEDDTGLVLRLDDSDDEDDEEVEDDNDSTTPAQKLDGLLDQLVHFAQHMPKDIQTEYFQLIEGVKAQVSKLTRDPMSRTTTQEAADSPAAPINDFDTRRNHFIGAIENHIEMDPGHNTDFFIEDLSAFAIDQWQQYQPGLQEAFTVDEIVAFCATLDDGISMLYHKDKKAFTYNPSNA